MMQNSFGTQPITLPLPYGAICLLMSDLDEPRGERTASEEACAPDIKANSNFSFNYSVLSTRQLKTTNSSTSTMSFSVARRATTQVASRSLSRRMSTAPRLHKAKDEWAQFVSKRPAPDHLDAHKCFHPPYNPFVVGGGIVMVWVIGYGSMYFGFSWQQKKQGYWK